VPDDEKIKKEEGFEDPNQAEGTEADIICVFRKIRDEIKDWIKRLTQNL